MSKLDPLSQAPSSDTLAANRSAECVFPKPLWGRSRLPSTDPVELLGFRQ
jgi:hypothetical protein